MEGALADGPTISTHVLDAQTGRPLQGVVVQVTYWATKSPEKADFDEPVGGITDEDGRILRLTDRALSTDGIYIMSFRLEGPFFQEVSITFKVDDPSRSYHVPLLLAPYSLTTYRGS
jgi:5-hydroxyisourate hydrolase